MNDFKFPPVPKDVLEAFESLPKKTLDEINIQLVLFSGLEQIRNPTVLKDENEYQKLLIAVGYERMRLLRREAAKLDMGGSSHGCE